MPSKPFVLAILLFWGATSGWFIYLDVLPRILSGEPPPFTISLADEAQTQQGEESGIYWQILQNNQDMGYVISSVNYHKENDSFDLYSRYKFWTAGHSHGGTPNQDIESTYGVSRDGVLREVKAHLVLDIQVAHENVHAEGNLEGKVANGRFSPHVEVTLPSAGTFKQDLDPVQLSARGSVLNPMQPLNRLPGLRKGQHWRMPLVDPLTDVMQAVSREAAKKYNLPNLGGVEGSENRFLEARVLPDTQVLVWGGQQEKIPCLVIDYHSLTSEDISASTWVRESDGQVFQQKVTQRGKTLILLRLDPNTRVEDDPAPKRH